MIYFIQGRETFNIKIGYTRRDADRRLRELQTGSHEVLFLLAVIEDGDEEHERLLHQRFADNRLEGEWFKPSLDLLRYIAKETSVIRYSDIGYAVCVDEETGYAHIRRLLYDDKGVAIDSVDPVGTRDNVGEGDSEDNFREQMFRGFLAVLAGERITIHEFESPLETVERREHYAAMITRRLL